MDSTVDANQQFALPSNADQSVGSSLTETVRQTRYRDFCNFFLPDHFRLTTSCSTSRMTLEFPIQTS
jgi:hypothetical protein